MTGTHSDAETETPAQALAEYLRENVGDHLRSVIRYDEEGAELVYVREDVSETYSEWDIERVFRDVRIESMGKPLQEDLYEHGVLNCTVRSFDDGVEMHFPRDETAGVAVAFDSEVFATHNTFLGKCMELMEK